MKPDGYDGEEVFRELRQRITRIGQSSRPVVGIVAEVIRDRGGTVEALNRRRDGADLSVTSCDGQRKFRVRVKSKGSGTVRWFLAASAEADLDEDLFYIFVDSDDTFATLHYHVVDAKTVANQISDRHRKWLSKPKRDGTPRTDSNMRKFGDDDHQYREAWHLLGLREQR